jgi:hypothetical protein
MLPLERQQSGGKLRPQSDLQGGVFLEEMSCRLYDKKKFFYQQIGLKFEKESSEMLQLEHGFVWC